MVNELTVEKREEVPFAEKILETEEENKLKQKTKKLSIIEGSGYSIMDGFGLKYISPFAIAIGATNAQIGLLGSIPGLLGNLAQIFGSKLIEKVSRKKIIILGVFLQALTWLPLLALVYLHYVMGLNGLYSGALLVIFYTFMTLVGAFSGPAWNSLMKEIVSEKSGEYFGRRNRICGAVGLASMLIAGAILDYFNNHSVIIGFTVLFAVALIGRSISAFMFTKHYEPKFVPTQGYYFSFFQFVKRMPKNNFGKFVIFVALINLATAIAGPFFAVYQLKDLQLSYLSYTLLVMSNVVATLLFMPMWGKFGDKYGTVKVMKIAGYLIPIIPVLYVLSIPLGRYDAHLVLPFLMIAEAFSGYIWAGFNLSASNFIYDAVTKERMALCIAYYSVINSIGVFVGASIGGALASYGGTILGMKPLIFVFLLSALARFAMTAIMGRKLREVREVEDFDVNSHMKNRLKKGLSVIRPSQFWKYIGIREINKN